MSSENGKNGAKDDSPNTPINGQQANNVTTASNQNGSNGNANGSNVIKEGSNNLKVQGDVSIPGKSPNISPDTSFEHVSFEDAIQGNTFVELMEKTHSKQYDIAENQEPLIYGKCKILFEKDYVCKVVNNCNYSMNYPIGIIVPVGKKADGEGSSMDFDESLYSKLVAGAPEARLRSRFVTPVMLFDNKFICRSGTLTVKLSAFYEKAKKTAPSSTTYDEDAFGILRTVTESICNLGSLAYQTFASLIDWNSMDSLFSVDVQIMKHLKIERVFDLMVEYSKLFKQTISVSSTEKAHENLYGDVKLEELPFPGCEFFKSYTKVGKNGRLLIFNWKQTDVTRELKLTNPISFYSKINVEDHKKWDLIELTQNYLKIILSCLVKDAGSVLIHCISGWDRTPLFVSLVRLSLWADGVVHESLEYEDMAYLTVAYDWFLFGHNLPDRILKSEEVMHFCFNVLEHITSDEFSVTRLFHELSHEEKRNRIFPEFVPGRRSALSKIRTFVLKHYDAEIRRREMELSTEN